MQPSSHCDSPARADLPPDGPQPDAATAPGATLSPAQQMRQAWLAVLAQAPLAWLEQALQAALPAGWPAYDWLRAPETGLAMVRARVGGSGDPFNLGEATVTRATLRLRRDAGETAAATIGVAYALGRDKRRAELAALSDALLQRPATHDLVHRHVIAPLRGELAAQHARQGAETAATRVEFFTMVRGD